MKHLFICFTFVILLCFSGHYSRPTEHINRHTTSVQNHLDNNLVSDNLARNAHLRSQQEVPPTTYETLSPPLLEPPQFLDTVPDDDINMIFVQDYAVSVNQMFEELKVILDNLNREALAELDRERYDQTINAALLQSSSIIMQLTELIANNESLELEVLRNYIEDLQEWTLIQNAIKNNFAIIENQFTPPINQDTDISDNVYIPEDTNEIQPDDMTIIDNSELAENVIPKNNLIPNDRLVLPIEEESQIIEKPINTPIPEDDSPLATVAYLSLPENLQESSALRAEQSQNSDKPLSIEALAADANENLQWEESIPPDSPFIDTYEINLWGTDLDEESQEAIPPTIKQSGLLSNSGVDEEKLTQLKPDNFIVDDPVDETLPANKNISLDDEEFKDNEKPISFVVVENEDLEETHDVTHEVVENNKKNTKDNLDQANNARPVINEITEGVIQTPPRNADVKQNGAAQNNKILVSFLTIFFFHLFFF